MVKSHSQTTECIQIDKNLIDECLKSLSQTQSGDLFTAEELSDATGIYIDHMRKLIKKVMDAGLCERDFKMVECLDGTLRPSPAYKLTQGTATTNNGGSK